MPILSYETIHWNVPKLMVNYFFQLGSIGLLNCTKLCTVYSFSTKSIRRCHWVCYLTTRSLRVFFLDIFTELLNLNFYWTTESTDIMFYEWIYSLRLLWLVDRGLVWDLISTANSSLQSLDFCLKLLSHLYTSFTLWIPLQPNLFFLWLVRSYF